MAKFKVGDKVRIREWDDMEKQFGLNPVFGSIACTCSFSTGMKHLCGRTATITSIDADRGWCELEFDDKSGRLDWIYTIDMIEPVRKDTIVIYRNGQDVIALDKRDGRKATATCSKDDTFDFAVGAHLALERLLPAKEPEKKEPEKKYYTGKAVYVLGNDSGFTVGKVYTFVDGRTRDDDGDIRPCHDWRIGSLSDYNLGETRKFIEFKGEA